MTLPVQRLTKAQRIYFAAEQSAFEYELSVPDTASLADLTPDGAVVTILFGCYQVPGDAPPFRYRRASSTEVTLPGVLSDAAGTRWVIAETELLPEWFGAKGNATGEAGEGADDAPAFRDMLDCASGLKVTTATLPGRKYRFASFVAHPGGQKTVLLVKSDTVLMIRSELVHDCFAASGSPVFIFTNGTAAARIRNVHIAFTGQARIFFPADPNRPASARKGCMTLYYADLCTLTRASTGGVSPTGFQVTCYNSSDVLIDGGLVGYKAVLTEAGDDGLHIIGGCKNIIARGLNITSGDDCISLTHEGGTLNGGTGSSSASNQVIENVVISDIVCQTTLAKSIKFDIDQTVENCTIRNVTVSNVIGNVSGTTRGGCIVIVNPKRVAQGNSVRNIKIVNCNLSPGELPKSDPDSGSELGSAVSIADADDVEITNLRVRGAWNSGLFILGCRNVSVNGLTFTGNPAAKQNILTGLSVVSVDLQSNSGYRRYKFSGNPDLSAIASIVAKANDLSNGANVYENRYPILNASQLTVPGLNGSFVIRAVDNVNKTVDIEQYRTQIPNASGEAGSASIARSSTPTIYVINSDYTYIRGRVINPTGWTTMFVGGRGSGGVSNYTDAYVEVAGQTYGYGIFVKHATRGRYGLDAQNCTSGSYMMRIETANAISDPLNVIVNSTDHEGLGADPLKGFGRTCLTDFSKDRIDLVRGRQSSRVRGTVTQAAGSTLVGGSTGIYLNVNSYAGYLSTDVTAAHLLKITPRAGGHGGISDVNWDAPNARFVINTISAPSAAVTWDYVVGIPD